MKLSGPGVLFVRKLLTTNLISLIDMGLFRLFIPEYGLVICVFQGISPFHLSCQTYGHGVVHSISLVLSVSMETPLSFLTPLICIPSLSFFPLISLARGLGLSVLLFSKNQLWVSPIFSTLSFISLISALIYLFL